MVKIPQIFESVLVVTEKSQLYLTVLLKIRIFFSMDNKRRRKETFLIPFFLTLKHLPWEIPDSLSS